jgi:hypothetical protein
MVDAGLMSVSNFLIASEKKFLEYSERDDDIVDTLDLDFAIG